MPSMVCDTACTESWLRRDTAMVSVANCAPCAADSVVWRTVPLLVTNPGRLTREWVAGKRARYVSPLGLFLFTIFLAEISYVATRFENPLYSEEMGIMDFLKQPDVTIVQALILRFSRDAYLALAERNCRAQVARSVVPPSVTVSPSSGRAT